MTMNVLAELTVFLTLALQARAQLSSCADINCPMEDATYRCEVDGNLMAEIGVSNFSSALSPDPLSWTIGYVPQGNVNTTSERKYFLGTPAGLDLAASSDVDGCALFFTGIEAGLSFVKPDGTDPADIDIAASSGTCADALGSACETDLINQARVLLSNPTASGGLQCSDLATALQSSPPKSCTPAGTWGDITAKSITGSSVPPALQLDSCHPANNATYSVHDIVTFPTIGNQPSSNYITPLLTVFTSSDDNVTGGLTNPEVHLNCMKPILASPTNNMVRGGDGPALRVRKSLLSIPITLTVFLAAAVFMA